MLAFPSRRVFRKGEKRAYSSEKKKSCPSILRKESHFDTKKKSPFYTREKDQLFEPAHGGKKGAPSRLEVQSVPHQEGTFYTIRKSQVIVPRGKKPMVLPSLNERKGRNGGCYEKGGKDALFADPREGRGREKGQKRGNERLCRPWERWREKKKRYTRSYFPPRSATRGGKTQGWLPNVGKEKKAKPCSVYSRNVEEKRGAI